MPGPIALGIGALFALVGYKAYTAFFSMAAYRDKAKADTVAAPPGFLQLAGRPSPSLRFFRINDAVMGGRSSSALEARADRSLLFSGTIDTNGGGFASCRTLGDDAPLGLVPRTRAIYVDAAGDGQRHKATLHTADSWSFRTSWAHDFVASKKRTTHRLLLSDFKGSRGPRRVKGAPPVDPEAVTGLGFSLSLLSDSGEPNPDFGPGPFKLQVYGVRAE